ncbi:uncharacterized protein LOC131619823 [Vicia villosa]|uniref:uncharacterized protein LOC131619823 n=1 Tax=Vicia villosa TaxID=3911 RepID=UPI00273AEB4D|nr:uncharacterized protein LOC131619823 [Vicia villosa]
MRCKKHLPDISSTVGVCASCLRERLLKIVESQAQPSRVSVSEPKLPSLEPIFPTSVSPYVAHRKSDDRRREVLFHSTPQGGRGLSAACDGATTQSSKRRIRKFWILSDLYRPRSSKTENSSGESCEPSSSVSPRSLTWLSAILPVRRQNNRVSDQRRCREMNRGATPVDKENFEGRDQSELGTSLESSPYRNKTTAVTTRRSRLGYAGKSLASMALCLSPMVRASPNRNWSNHNHKGFSQELGVGGVQHISTAASMCANRSKKLVDLGKVAHNHKR